MLPFDISRRENSGYIVGWRCFNPRSELFGRVIVQTGWFDVQELRFEVANELDKFVSLGRLEERFSGKFVKFVVEKGEI